MIQYHFYNPTRLVFGEGSIGQIGKLVAEQGIRKVLLIAGGGSIKQNGVYQTATSALQAANVAWVECWGVRANPELGKVREAIALARQEGVEAVLAVGGGSVIDTAKAVAAGFYLNDVWQAYEGKEKISQALPIFTILTLSATASEMNGNAVISNDAEKKKWGIGNAKLYPKVSIIDPAVQNSLPWQQTVNGALDALAHIMEFYFVGTTQETTSAVNEALMRTIISMVDNLQVDPADADSRANLAWAVTLGLNGMSGAGMNGGDWACHGMEHSVSSFDPKVAHGAGLGVIFPAWMQYVEQANPAQFARFARNVWGCATLAEAIAAMKTKIKAWNGQTTLRELGVPEAALPEIAANAVLRGPVGRLKPLEQADVEAILRLAY